MKSMREKSKHSTTSPNVNIPQLHCGILGLIKIPPEKKDEKRDNKLKKETTDEQTNMQSWDRKRQKMENLQLANILSKKPKN
jgi:hypothetical protein